jgi:hypothetical protein
LTPERTKSEVGFSQRSKSLGLTIPPGLLIAADEVIE